MACFPHRKRALQEDRITTDAADRSEPPEAITSPATQSSLRPKSAKLQHDQATPDAQHVEAHGPIVKSIAGIIRSISMILTQDSEFMQGGICESDISFCATSWADFGWGCGFRNTQHLLSSLLQTDPETYRTVFGSDRLLTISKLQRGIESAWSHGYDQEGAMQLDRKLSGTKKWIGTTEVYAFLTYHGHDCSILQFSGRDHVPKLMQYCKEYFMGQNGDNGPGLQVINKHAIYFQHQGHSRTIVGYVCFAHEAYLVVFDPAKRVSSHMMKALSGTGRHHSNEHPQSLLKPYLIKASSLRKKAYQLLTVHGRLSDSAMQARKVIKPHVF